MIKPINEQLNNIEDNVAAAPKQKRGFASMDPDKRRAICRKGGASVPSHLRSFSKDPNLAANAGRKGGLVGHGGGRLKKETENDG